MVNDLKNIVTFRTSRQSSWSKKLTPIQSFQLRSGKWKVDSDISQCPNTMSLKNGKTQYVIPIGENRGCAKTFTVKFRGNQKELCMNRIIFFLYPSLKKGWIGQSALINSIVIFSKNIFEKVVLCSFWLWWKKVCTMSIIEYQIANSSEGTFFFLVRILLYRKM